MGKVFLFSFLVIPLSAVAGANRIDCYNVMEGEDIGGKFEVKASFDSSVPSFVDEITTTLNGRAPKTTKTTYLSAKSVCGLKIDFAESCGAEEKFTKFGYLFSFTCGNEITRGEIYCDEECLKEGSLATFKCEGPKVEKTLSDGGLVYQKCKVSQAK